MSDGAIVDEGAGAVSEARWRRIQAISGLLFLLFTLVHVVNTSLAAISPAAYDGFQRVARGVYQYPLVEFGLIFAPLVVHVVAALRRMWRDGVRRRGGSLRARLHRVTGYFLLAVIFGHISAVRGPSLFGDVFLEFGGVSFSIWMLPFVFYPYYALLIAAGVFHGVNGALLACARLRVHVPTFLRQGPGFWVPVGTATALGLLGLLGLGGALYDIPDPSQSAFAQMWEELGIYEWLERPTGS